MFTVGIEKQLRTQTEMNPLLFPFFECILKCFTFRFLPLVVKVLPPPPLWLLFSYLALVLATSYILCLIKHVWEPLLPHMGFDLLHTAAGLQLGSHSLSSLPPFLSLWVSVLLSSFTSGAARHFNAVDSTALTSLYSPDTCMCLSLSIIRFIIAVTQTFKHSTLSCIKILLL